MSEINALIQRALWDGVWIDPEKAAGFGRLLGPLPGGRFQNSSRHADFTFLMQVVGFHYRRDFISPPYGTRAS
jgi:hypothetical protein